MRSYRILTVLALAAYIVSSALSAPVPPVSEASISQRTRVASQPVSLSPRSGKVYFDYQPLSQEPEQAEDEQGAYTPTPLPAPPPKAKTIGASYKDISLRRPLVGPTGSLPPYKPPTIDIVRPNPPPQFTAPPLQRLPKALIIDPQIRPNSVQPQPFRSLPSEIVLQGAKSE